MRKVNIKHLRDNLSKELKDLPLSVTSDGQVVATILTLEQYNKLVKGYQEVATTIKARPDIRAQKLGELRSSLDADGNKIYEEG